MVKNNNKKNLDQIIKDGYKLSTFKFADLDIYEKDNLRILYDPKKDEVVHMYDINKTGEYSPNDKL